VLAVLSEFRGRRLGTRLLTIAEEIALRLDKRGLSINVSDADLDARRRIERAGCGEVSRRAMVKEALVNAGHDWVLLVKRFERPTSA
jgi:GNAT superfamily N-acetyltransferase